jgi:hypothetical protein
MVDNTEIDKMQNEIKKGSLILIKKGTRLATTAPNGRKEAGRDYIVEVFDVDQPAMITAQLALSDEWYHDLVVQHGTSIEELQALKAANSMEYYRRLVPISHAKVTWVGGGGYWCHAALADVEYAGEKA